MWYSVEILQNGSLVMQPKATRIRHGALGRVLIPQCSKSFAEKILSENLEVT